MKMLASNKSKKQKSNYREFDINNKPHSNTPIAFILKEEPKVFHIGRYLAHYEKFYCINDHSISFKEEEILKWKYINI